MNRWIAMLAAPAVAFTMTACDVEQTQEGELPDIDVSGDAGELPDVDVQGGRAPDMDVDATGGQMPEFDVDAPDVDVRTQEQRVTVPDVDVDRRETTVPVPDIDINTRDDAEQPTPPVQQPTPGNNNAPGVPPDTTPQPGSTTGGEME